MVGHSPAFLTAVHEATLLAPSDLPVVITGETGVGKEVFAAFVHKRSARAGGPFVTLDCCGLSETLFESELFGHEAGAFTGAQRQKRGLFEQADGGTLFSTRSARSPRFRPSCCESSRPAISGASAAPNSSRPMCASSPRPTATCAK